MNRFIWHPTYLMIVVCIANGCRYGQFVEDFAPAQLPNGAMVEVVTNQRQLEGELVEVRDTGIVILTGNQLQFLPYDRISSIRIEPTGQNFQTGSRPLDRREMEEVRLLSRYPQGMSPEVLAQLLAVYGQTQLGGEGP